MDGGMRSGQDVLRALAYGARACMIGRSYIYGLGAYGQAGVAKAIEIIGKELDVTMALTGTKSVRGRRPAGDWPKPEEKGPERASVGDARASAFYKYPCQFTIV